MTTEEIKEGDVVMLKSGGPQMTVVEIEKDKTARCVWFPKGCKSGMALTWCW